MYAKIVMDNLQHCYGAYIQNKKCDKLLMITKDSISHPIRFSEYL